MSDREFVDRHSSYSIPFLNMNNPPKDLAFIHMPQSVAKWWLMVGIGLGVLMYTIDSSIVNTHYSFVTISFSCQL
jgi:hypothetical protein